MSEKKSYVRVTGTRCWVFQTAKLCGTTTVKKILAPEPSE